MTLLKASVVVDVIVVIVVVVVNVVLLDVADHVTFCCGQKMLI